MLSIIFTENSTTRSGWANTMTALIGGREAEVLSLSSANASVVPQAMLVPTTGSGSGKRLAMATTKAKGDTVLFLDSRIDMSNEEASELMNQLEAASDATIAYTPLRIGQETVELPSMDAEDLVSSITGTQNWPTGIVAVKREFMSRIDLSTATSLTEALVSAMITAGTEGEEIRKLDLEIGMPISPESYAVCQMTASETSRTLQCAVNSARIEDLFPNHPWTTHGEESAAASYHELAARFLKFSDISSAEECLGHSDKFEDSPRSLALKGLIALLRGETLGAVANMVSSLQQYELRKQDRSSVHYVTFSPRNIETINSNLNKGLEALNRRDNETAIEFFKEAVFLFDPFFREIGVDQVAQ